MPLALLAFRLQGRLGCQKKAGEATGDVRQNMKLADITFRHALTLGPHCNDGRIEFTIESSALTGTSPGVYFVLQDEEPVYVGSYQSGVVRRWVYLRKKDLYHFKKPLVAESLDMGSALRVYAQDEDSIKEELGYAQNPWVNSTSIEARLISILHPPWNYKGKKSNQSVQASPTSRSV